MSETKLQLLRNSNLFNSKQDAIRELENIMKGRSDGEIVLARYKDGGNVETVFGLVTKSSGNSGYTIFEKSSSVINEEITVAGSNLGGYKIGDKINAGTSVEEILKNLLCEEIYPSAAKKPSIDIDGEKSFGLVEAYSSVTIPQVSIQKIDGEFKASYTNVKQPTVEGVTWGGGTINSVVSGFSGITNQSGTGFISSSSAIANVGSNTVTYSASANYSAPTNKPITNLKNETTKTGNTAADGTATWTAGTATKSGVTTTAVGVLPCYINISGGTLISSDVKLSLQSGTTFTIDVPSQNDAGIAFRFTFPASHTISSFKEITLGSLDVPSDAYKLSDTTKTIGTSTNVTYKKMEFQGTLPGISTYKITLNKNLNQK